jgi:hypothetical protein
VPEEVDEERDPREEDDVEHGGNGGVGEHGPLLADTQAVVKEDRTAGCARPVSFQESFSNLDCFTPD